MALPLEKRTAVVRGVRLFYRERAADGDDVGAPMLLLHGLLASAKTFRDLIAHLPDDRRIVALDLPGTVLEGGAASDLAQDFSFAGLAELVREFSKVIHLEQPVLLGHSHGGAIALTIEGQTPEFARGVILLGPAHPFLYRERKLVGFYNSAFGAFAAWALPKLPHPLQYFGFRRMLGPVGRARPVRFRAYRQAMREPLMMSKARLMLRTWNADMMSLAMALAKQPVAVPALLLWGDADLVVPLATAESLQPLLARWQMVVLPGVGHLPNDEAPEECGKLITQWMRRVGV